MMRSRSTISRPGPNPNLFVANGPSPISRPAIRNSLPIASSRSLGGYLQNQPQYTTNAFVPNDSPMMGQPHHGDLGRELDIGEFLSMHNDDLFSSTSPINIPPSTLLSPQESEQYPSSGFPSVCGSMTSGPTLETAPMSRCNSSLNDGISGQFEMVRIQSQQSAQNFRPSPMAAHPPLLGKRASEDSGIICMQGNSFQYAYPSSAPTQSLLAQHQHAMEASLSQSSMRSTSSAGLSPHDLDSPFLAQHLSMERSVSKDSIKSNASLKLRAKEALSRQNYAAKSRLLQPKPAAGTAEPETADPVNISPKDGKAAISKTRYERPKHPKVMCNQCNEHPEGFRGEHELRRHTEAKHKSLVKKWICRDPDLAGIPHSETAVKPLRDCKQCSQSKPYGAYYNAAAHLRRTHFKVKPRKGAAGAKNGQSKVDDSAEKRGGKGGGDWPSMNELKLWMVEVTMPMDQDGALVADGTESVGALDAEDFDNEFDSQYSSQGGAHLAMGPNGFDMAAFAGVGDSFDQAIDLTGPSFHNELQLSEMFPLDGPVFPTSSSQGIPISSSGFDYRNSDMSSQQTMAASMMSLDSHGYTSPVSSTATITQTGAFMDQMMPQAGMQVPRDDLADLPFDLTFATAGQ